METDSQKVNTACKVCRDRDFAFFAEKNNCQIYKCLKCGLIFVWPLPNNFSAIYSSDYFSGAHKGFGYVDYDRDKAAMADVFNVYLDKIGSFMPHKGRLLDIGAATGYFLSIAKKRGWKVYGVEISEHAANLAREKGLNVLTGTLTNANFPAGFFDVVTLWDVIEHLPDPEVDLCIAFKLLKPGGLVVINTPDADSFYAKIMGRRWHALLPPEHLTIFNLGNLSVLLGQAGFKVVAVDKIGKRFTLQYIFKILDNWHQFFIWHWIAKKLQGERLGKIIIPINLRDNFFVIASKVND
jgi:SAM-dependent methyltransferase